MARWPDNWKSQALSAAGIPATPKALKVMAAWAQSTPLQPWTNNPLGMPALAKRIPAVPSTQYAMFSSITDFYAAFGMFATTPKGRALAHEITSDDGYGPTWRAIASLGWPGSKTETDYPSAVLDLAGQSYIDSVTTTAPQDRKTSGVPKAPPDVHAVMRQQAQSLVDASRAFNDASTAVRYLIRRHVSRG